MEEKEIKSIQIIFAILALFFSIIGIAMIILKNWYFAAISWNATGAFLWLLVICQNRKIIEIENEIKRLKRNQRIVSRGPH